MSDLFVNERLSMRERLNQAVEWASPFVVKRMRVVLNPVTKDNLHVKERERESEVR